MHISGTDSSLLGYYTVLTLQRITAKWVCSKRALGLLSHHGISLPIMLKERWIIARAHCASRFPSLSSSRMAFLGRSCVKLRNTSSFFDYSSYEKQVLTAVLPASHLAIHWSLINLQLQSVPIHHKLGACYITGSSNALYITFIYHITQPYEK